MEKFYEHLMCFLFKLLFAKFDNISYNLEYGNTAYISLTL